MVSRGTAASSSDCLLLHLDKTTRFYALVLTSLQISERSCPPTVIENGMISPLRSCWRHPTHNEDYGLFFFPQWTVTTGLHTTLGKSRTYPSNTNAPRRAIYTYLENVSAHICSAAPTTDCSLVLVNHELWALYSHYPTHTPHPPTLLAPSQRSVSLHSTALPTPCLSQFFSASAILVQGSEDKLGTHQLLPPRCSSTDLLTMMKVEFATSSKSRDAVISSLCFFHSDFLSSFSALPTAFPDILELNRCSI